ncbi:MAG: DUF167 family protein [Hyphomonadaceae bacterium]
MGSIFRCWCWCWCWRCCATACCRGSSTACSCRGGALARLRVRLTPSGGADRIDGAARDEKGAYLKARVRAAPEHGEANTALEELIAEAFGVAKTKVSVSRGQTARLKTLEIAGASATEVAAFLRKFGDAP